MAMRRNWLTGEWEEYEPPQDGREIIFRGEIPEGAVTGRANSPWSTPLVSDACAIHPDQAGQFSEDAKRHGTGAWYNSKGQAVFESRQARARELKRRGFFDKDAGYGDYAGQ